MYNVSLFSIEDIELSRIFYDLYFPSPNPSIENLYFRTYNNSDVINTINRFFSLEINEKLVPKNNYILQKFKGTSSGSSYSRVRFPISTIYLSVCHYK